MDWNGLSRLGFDKQGCLKNRSRHNIPCWCKALEQQLGAARSWLRTPDPKLGTRKVTKEACHNGGVAVDVLLR
jgi:hypothetical protein